MNELEALIGMSASNRVTRYSDVCGGTDEFKRILTEEGVRAATADGCAELAALVADGAYMLARMQVRLTEYEAFREAVRSTLASLDAIVPPDMPLAERETTALEISLGRNGADLDARDLIHRVEEVRQVANDMEGALRRHQEGAVAIARAYGALRGHRGWPDGLEPEMASADPVRDAPAWIPQAWLPPSPHREHIVASLVRGRASLLTESELDAYPVGPQGREPIVQFEDGGVMPLRVVRYDEAVENFYPLGQEPHPRGLLYRPRDAGPDAPPA
jgi:hypothetical protein